MQGSDGLLVGRMMYLSTRAIRAAVAGRARFSGQAGYLWREPGASFITNANGGVPMAFFKLLADWREEGALPRGKRGQIYFHTARKRKPGKNRAV